VARPQAQKHLEAKIKEIKQVRDQFSSSENPQLDEVLTNLRERMVALHREQ
jgi:hypothetical protein